MLQLLKKLNEILFTAHNNRSAKMLAAGPILSFQKQGTIHVYCSKVFNIRPSPHPLASKEHYHTTAVAPMATYQTSNDGVTFTTVFSSDATPFRLFYCYYFLLIQDICVFLLG